MSPEEKRSLNEVVHLFDEAEHKTKEIEQFVQELSIPSINELRYSGYHLARAFTYVGEQRKEFDEQISKAKRHCERAIYDAHEVGIIYMLEKIKNFKERYSGSSHTVAEIIPDYVDDLVSVDEASKLIGKAHEGHIGDRATYYEECRPHYNRVWEISSKFEKASPLIDEKIHKNIRKEQKETRRFITTTLLTFLGIAISFIVGATLIYLNLYGGN
ncbi:hypothetical protein [Halorhodospira halochloris]|uniref:hypothetical protein n=1 Tax=Halorhodospira halochloris TaxID=1052 RepID=UPI001EE96C14|nr:hypothetical protein [Halorhodospira halochloris]MCG5549266.1 hypothetical protein [Halorhodospira halochloris]